MPNHEGTALERIKQVFSEEGWIVEQQGDTVDLHYRLSEINEVFDLSITLDPNRSGDVDLARQIYDDIACIYDNFSVLDFAGMLAWRHKEPFLHNANDQLAIIAAAGELTRALRRNLVAVRDKHIFAELDTTKLEESDYTVTLDDIRSWADMPDLSDADATMILKELSDRFSEELAEFVSYNADKILGAARLIEAADRTHEAAVNAWDIDEPAVGVEIAMGMGRNGSDNVNIITPAGTVTYSDVLIGQPYGTPTHSYVNLAYVPSAGPNIPIGTVEILEGDDFAKKVGAQVKAHYGEALEFERQGYIIDCIEVEYADTRNELYKALPAGTVFPTLEDATQALREKDAIIQDARARVTPEDKAEENEVFCASVGYDKNYINIHYRIRDVVSGGIVEEKAHLRFDIGDGPESLDVRKDFEWHKDLVVAALKAKASCSIDSARDARKKSEQGPTQPVSSIKQ